jgi:hypothetical protein
MPCRLRDALSVPVIVRPHDLADVPESLLQLYPPSAFVALRILSTTWSGINPK